MKLPLLPTLLLSTVLLTGLSGCYYYDCPDTTSTVRYYQDPAYVEVQSEPPPLRAAVEVRPSKPNANAVWVAGHYVWRGSWIWVDGHWETPRAGYVWTAPTVVRVDGRYRYHPGYWRPRTVQAAPVYRQPGTVRVSVRPRATTVQQGGGTQTVTVQGARTTGTATVQTRPSSSGTVRVQGQPSGSGTVRVQGQPSSSGTVRVQGGTQTTADPGTATVRVQGGTRTTATPGTRRPNATVQGGVRTTGTPTVQQGGNVRVQTPTAGTRSPTTGATVQTRGGTGQTTATVRGGVRTGAPATATTRVGTAGGANTGTVALSCRTNTQRAPRGGYITISGAGFGSGATVMIGGNIAAVSRAQSGRVRAQVPRDSNGGAVTIRDGNRTARCGNLQIVGR